MFDVDAQVCFWLRLLFWRHTMMPLTGVED